VPFEPAEFGRYYLVDKIAVGGMAEVFKAKSYSERGFEKLLVIKRILDHLSDNDEFVEMFIDEAKISVELQHANIVQIYDFGKAGDNYYIAMECVEGKDVKSMLRKLARRRKLMPQEFAAYFAAEACRGLDYAHKRTDLDGKPLNIVHRDISPSNLIVSYTGDVKVADFGIAKAENAAYNTKDGVLKGKFEYMSPEQASGKAVDHRSDVFAVGIILHEMLTGRRLFKTDSDVATLEKIKKVDIPTPREVNPTIPAALDALVMKALAREPSDRYADARALQAALVEYIYPTTPDAVRERVHSFMGELFAEEIAKERERLAEGSRVAEALRARPRPAPVQDWEGTPSAGTTVQPAPPPSRLPLVLAGVAIALLAVFTGIFLLRDQERSPQVIEVRAAEKPPVIQLVIEPPEASPVVTLDGQPLAEGKTRVTAETTASEAPRTLRVTAEGFDPYEETVQLGGGDRYLVKVQLEATAPAAPEEPASTAPVPAAPAPSEAPSTPEAAPAALAIGSTPAGATVVVNGRAVGKTPVQWSGASAGVAYRVELRMTGHEPERFSLTVPPSGGTVSAERRLKAKQAAAPGTLTVSVRGGWGNVFVNGKKVDQTPLSTKLPPGSYTVRVENADAGLDETRKVDIQSGEVTRLSL
jgi:tRNA A-37 threonylcarbamoyl transferase component Bud32